MLNYPYRFREKNDLKKMMNYVEHITPIVKSNLIFQY